MTINHPANAETTALIAGASSGIGLKRARAFAQNRHNLVLLARSQEKLDQVARELVAPMASL